MMVAVKKLLRDPNRLHLLSALFRHTDLTGQIFHIKFRKQLIRAADFLTRPDRDAPLKINQRPDRIRIHKPLPIRTLQHEIAHAHKAMDIIRRCSRNNGIPETREPPDINLPVIYHPGKMSLLQIVHPNPKVFRLKGGAILKIINQRFHPENSIRIRLAESHSSRKSIHKASHLNPFSPSLSFRKDVPIITEFCKPPYTQKNPPENPRDFIRVSFKKPDQSSVFRGTFLFDQTHQ